MSTFSRVNYIFINLSQILFKLCGTFAANNKQPQLTNTLDICEAE